MISQMILNRDIRAFLILGEELHFGRAATRMGIGQPQLTAVIHRLERVVGFRLFDRRPRVQLTHAGESLLVRSRQLEREAATAISDARAVAAGSLGSIRFGFSPTSMFGQLPNALHEFRVLEPRVSLALTERGSGDLLRSIQNAEFDLILSREAPTVGLQGFRAVRDELRLAVPANHRLAEAEQASLSELKDEQFIWFDRQSAPAFHDRLFSGFAAHGFEPKIVQSIESWTATAAMVRAGLGLTFVTEAVALYLPDGIKLLPISERMPDTDLWLVRRDDDLTPCSQKLWSHLAARLGAGGQG